MTYKEAKKYLLQNFFDGDENTKSVTECDSEIEAMKIAVESIDRRIPTEPIYEADGYSNGELVYDMWTCPNCNTLYEVGFDDYDFCPYCGQAIKADWSEENGL